MGCILVEAQVGPTKSDYRHEEVGVYYQPLRTSEARAASSTSMTVLYACGTALHFATRIYPRLQMRRLILAVCVLRMKLVFPPMYI